MTLALRLLIVIDLLMYYYDYTPILIHTLKDPVIHLEQCKNKHNKAGKRPTVVKESQPRNNQTIPFNLF